ncbi:MAG TPA: type II toxin-antitoxin system RelE/ParE family toxin [Opitutaceae bacterium]|jgi:mRNA-degrading endonuclease RelE of RelBE toxin-antitoxin system|nr:type II toxin-antitoxin system RelE/ParE family toxin [Opitutaceae bacterium]
MEFIEVPSFTPRVMRYLGDESYARLQVHLTDHPTAGAVIPGSKGLRKVRWAAKGHGKRGGVRVIYYWHVAPEIITFLDIYPKNEKDDLTKDELRLFNLLLEK